MQALTILKKFFSVDMVIYAAIVIVAATALLRCTLPLSRVAAKLRRAARTIVTESKQNKEKKSWNDMHFLGDSLSATWADFLQNAEMRDAHGETCDVTQYINEDTVIYALGSTGFAGLAPGVMTSLGILGTFLGLVMGLSGLSLTGADTEVVLTAMDQLIRGMSTAFLTSIAGVCGSLLFNLLNNRATDKCQKAIDRFCEVFSLYAMPKPVSEDTAMLALQQEQTAYIRQAVEDMSQKMAVQMEQSIMRAMLPVQRSMDNFILAATQAQVEGVDRIAQVFVQRMNVALGNEFDHLRQVLADTGAEQQKTQQELRAATKPWPDDAGRGQHAPAFSGVLHFRAYVAIWTPPAHRWTTQPQDHRVAGGDGQTSGQQALYLAKLQEYQAALTAASQQYTAWTDRFLASAQEQTRITGKEMDRVVAEMHEGSQTLSGAYEQFTRQTQENLARTTALFDESISSSIHQLNETLDSMREMTRSMPQLLSQSRDRYAEQVDQFVTALVRLQKAMEKLSQTADGKE
ncbi:MAG: MotA/TolQ/ExbB proton channel family protein [Christensenellales bacterium]